jgi:hypothetical protein
MVMSADNLKQDLSNAARVYLWDVVFASLPGGGNRDHLEVRAQSTVIPGKSFGDINIPFKGTPGIRIPGKLNMSHDWPAVFVEGLDQEVFKALNGWMQFIQNARTGIGALDISTKTDIYLRLLNMAGTVIKSIKLSGAYLKSIDDVPVAYDDEAVIMYSTVFSYDYWEEA